jgi:hypothetical protein
MWRELFKPLYQEYAEIAHAHGKFAFMHSDGNILDIYEVHVSHILRAYFHPIATLLDAIGGIAKGLSFDD